MLVRAVLLVVLDPLPRTARQHDAPNTTLGVVRTRSILMAKRGMHTNTLSGG
jgi:hypothetical protein